MKMMRDKSNVGKNKLREILYREKDVKIGFLDGLTSLWEQRRDEVQNIFFVSSPSSNKKFIFVIHFIIGFVKPLTYKNRDKYKYHSTDIHICLCPFT